MEDIYLTIIVPAYNEEKDLASSVNEVLLAVSTVNIKSEIIIVDDCSTDRTYEIACELGESAPRIKVIHNTQNLGLGGSYKAGLALASGTHVTWVPADESHPADGLISTYSRIGEADMIIPRAINPEVRGWQRRWISKTYTFLVNLFSGLNIPYYNGLSVHRLDLLRSIELASNGFGFQAEIIVKLVYRGASYIVTNAEILERQMGGSKAFTIKNIVSVIKVLLFIYFLNISNMIMRLKDVQR